MAFDLQGARQAGYSDAEIAAFLGSQVGFDVDGALKAGYEPGEVVGFLSERTAPKVPDATAVGVLGQPMVGGDPARRALPSGVKPSTGRASEDPRRLDRKPEGTWDHEPEGEWTDARSEASKGVASAVTGIKSMGPAFAVTADALIMNRIGERLSNWDKIDRGEWVPRAEGLAYQNADAAGRQALRDELLGEAAKRKEFVRGSIEAVKRYQREQQANRGRVADFTDIEDVKGFADWLQFNGAAGAVYLAPVMLAAAVGGAPGAFATSYALAAGEINSDRVGAAIEMNRPARFKNPDRQDAVDQTQGVAQRAAAVAPTTAAFALPNAALDVVAGPVRNLITKPLQGLTKKEALKRAPGQMARDVVEEGLTGAAQEVVNIAAERYVGEQQGDALTKENAKRVLNAGMAEAAGGPIGTAASVTGRMVQRDPTASILSAPTVDSAIQAAQDATSEPITPAAVPLAPPNISRAPAPEVQATISDIQQMESSAAVDRIGDILGTPNASPSPAVPPVDSGSGGSGAPVASPGLGADLGTGSAVAGAVEPAGVGSAPVGDAVPLGAGGVDAALSQPAAQWFGRRGDGYQTEADAQTALPSRLKVAPDLNWQVEPMPNGRFRLAGYAQGAASAQPTSLAPAQPAPASVSVTMNPTGTATVTGDPQAVAQALKTAGVTSFMPLKTGALVGVSQAQRAQQALASVQPQVGQSTNDNRELPRQGEAALVPGSSDEVAGRGLGTGGTVVAAGGVPASSAVPASAVGPEPRPGIHGMEEGDAGTGARGAGSEREDARAAGAGSSFAATLNPTGTLTIQGDPAAIKAALQAAGIKGAITRVDGVLVPTSQAEAAQRVPGINVTVADRGGDPFRTFLMRHGVALRLARDFAPGTKERLAMGKTFREGGMELDALAERAAEQGFIRDRMDTDTLYDLIARSVNGERIAPQQGEDADLELRARMDRQREFERMAAEKLQALSDGDLEIVADADDSIFAGNSSEADFMRAMGYSEQEIADAEKEAGRAPQGRAGDGGAVEAAARGAQEADSSREGEAQGLTPETGGFDSEKFDRERAERVKASREAGYTHLDKVPAYVETMRGKAIEYVHDPKVKGVIRTVDNRGNVYVNWSDAYSAEKELASEVQDGKRKVMQSSLGPSDLKDYRLQQKSGTLTSPTQSEVLAQQSRRENESTLDDKAQVDREAEHFTLSQQEAEEKRKDTSGDMFGGPSADDVRKSRELGGKPKDDGEGTFDADKKDILLSRGDTAKTGLTPPQFTAALTKAFGPKTAERLISEGVVVPLEDQSKLPKHVVPYLRDGDVVYGFYDPKTDRTYAVLSNLDAGMVKGLALHEVGVHYGFKAMLGDTKYGNVMKRLDMMHRTGSKAVRAARADAIENAADKSQVPEETLAYLVQNHPEMTLVQEVIAKIKAFLFNKFGIGGKYLSEADLVVLARAAVHHSARTEAGGVPVPAFMREQNDGMEPSDDLLRDPDGKPLTLYHGTPNGDITEFKTERGAWFTNNPKLAEQYTLRRGLWRSRTDGGAIYPVHLSMKNPLVIDALGKRNDNIPVPWAEWKPKVFGNLPKNAVSVADALVYAREHGHDGLIVKNVVDTADVSDKTKGDVYAVLDPEQVKSAISFSRTTAGRTNIAAPELSPWRDAAGRIQFAPGAWLWNKLDKGASPLLAKLELRAQSPELRRALREMKLTVAKAQETAEAVGKEVVKLTDAEREMVSDIIEREMAAGTIPPEHAVRLAAIMNEAIGRQTDELVNLGMLTTETAEEWRGKYLARYYKDKLGKKIGDAWKDAIFRMTGKPLKGIRGNHFKGRGLYEVIPESQLEVFEQNGWEVRDPAYQQGVTDGTVRVWRDFTREERERMGEIRDAGFRFVMGYMESAKDLALGRLFFRLAADPEMSGRHETEQFTVQVPDTSVEGTGVKRYGKLAGRYVSDETFSHLTQIEEAQSAAWRMYRKAYGIWKETKTALNPVAHANNVISNITMAHFAGVSYWDQHKYIAAMHDFATKADSVKEAKDAGLFLGTVSDAELMNVLPEDLRAIVRQQESAASKIGRTAFDVMTFFLRRPLGWAYQAEDTFFRYLIWKDARKQGMSAEDAVDYAQRYIFTYDDLPRTARRVRDFAIPFFAYTYKAIPALAHTAAHYPWRMAAPAAVLWGVNAAMYAVATGDDDDDWTESLKKYLTDPDYRAKAKEKEKLEREHLPEWMKGSTSLGTPKAIRLGMDEVTKLPVFLDVSRMIPSGDLFDMNPNGGGIEWFQPLTPNHPLLSVYSAMFNNKDAFYGKDVVDKNDTAEEKREKRAAWLWKQVAPALSYGNYHFERTMNAIANATEKPVQWAPDWLGGMEATGIGKDGLPVQPKYAAMQTFGVKARPLDLDRAEQIEESAKDRLIRDIDAELRSLRRLNNLGAVTDAQMDKARDKAQVKKDRLRDGLTVDGEPKR